MKLLNRYSDNRYKAISFGLEQLLTHQIDVLLEHIHARKPIVLDSCNYDVNKNSWCPLAIGLSVPEMLEKHEIPCHSDAEAKKIITETGKKQNDGFTLNPLRGVEGKFFKDNRLTDLKIACEDILIKRKA